MPGPKAHGEAVNYYLPDGPSKGQARVALVASYHSGDAQGVVDLWVFGNPRSDGPTYDSPVFVASVSHGTGTGQWN